MTRLHDLYEEQGQSPWLDNLRRDWISSGELQSWVEKGVRGLTSNPSIFEKAITNSYDYDEQFLDLIRSDLSVEAAYWELVLTDIKAALAILRPIYDASEGADGYVSVEVDPSLAHRTEGTIEAARALSQELAEPNLYVKIPGTQEGLPAIRQMISEGLSINVTLLFSVSRYAEVIEAYISGLEEAEGDLSSISSVASFFISRTDSAVDKQLDAIATKEALSLKGKAAVAQGRLAYQLFLERFSGPRWEKLATRGARPQRPLWASTSTKNPDYPDTLYVDSLIGPNTVNTIPDSTLAAFLDHGTVARTVDTAFDDARKTLNQIRKLGVDLDEVATSLEAEGVVAFSDSFNNLLETLSAKVTLLHS